MPRTKGSKNKKKGIAPFEITHEANILRETADGGFVTDEFVPMEAPQSQETAPIPSESKQNIYSLVLKLNDQEYTATSDNLTEALLSFKPEFFNTTGILIIKKGDKEVERVLNIRNMRRLWNADRPDDIVLDFTTANIKFLLGEN